MPKLKILLLCVCISLISTHSYAVSHEGNYKSQMLASVSYYHEGHSTASGERFNKNAMTCAHRRLPFGTIVKVEYRGKVAECRVNDRGPYIRGRSLDVSLGVARKLAMLASGVIRASISW